MLPWDHNGECLYCDEFGEHSPDCEWVKENMPNINQVSIGMNRYCGPAVLSILTGKNTDQAAAAIYAVAPYYRGEGVNIQDMLRALDKLGFNQEKIAEGSTLYGSLTRIVGRDGMYIVGLHNDDPKKADGHMVCIEVQERRIYFCDNHTKIIMPASQSARLLQKVKYIYRVSKRPDPILLGKTRRVVISVMIYEKLEYDQPSANTEYVVESKDFHEVDKAIEYLKGE